MPAFVIFIDGADTEPAKLPVYVVEGEEHASSICEGMKESEYGVFAFSFHHCLREDRARFAVWATMILDVNRGVYGTVPAGIHAMIDDVYSLMVGRTKPPEKPKPINGSQDGRTTDERNVAVRDYLVVHKGRNAKVKAAEIAEALGASDRSVKATDAWKAYQSTWTEHHGKSRTRTGKGRKLGRVDVNPETLDSLIREQAADEKKDHVEQFV